MVVIPYTVFCYFCYINHPIPTNNSLNTSNLIFAGFVTGILHYRYYIISLFFPQIEEIVGSYGLVCISRSGCNPHKFIYESDVLTKFQVSVLLQVWLMFLLINMTWKASNLVN